MTRPSRPLSRHEARRRALDVLYEADVLRRDLDGALERVRGGSRESELDGFARELVAGVAEHRPEIDEIIGDHAKGWSVARMPIVDRNVLRLAVYELCYGGDAPAAVVIDEAVELAKELSTEESPRYVNGVLSAVLRSRERPAP